MPHINPILTEHERIVIRSSNASARALAEQYHQAVEFICQLRGRRPLDRIVEGLEAALEDALPDEYRLVAVTETRAALARALAGEWSEIDP